MAAPTRPAQTGAGGEKGRSATSKRLVAGAAAVAVVAVALVAGLLLRTPPADGDAAVVPTDSAVRVAVLPSTVRGNPDIEYLSQGMVDILATKLDGAGSWRTVDPRAVLGSLGGVTSSVDPAGGTEVAVRLGADRFILGSIIQAGDRLQVRASVYDPESNREPVSVGSVEGPADAPSHLHRAEIYEETGDPVAAAEHYRRFLELWNEADSQLQPVIDRARERLDALQVPETE